MRQDWDYYLTRWAWRILAVVAIANAVVGLIVGGEAVRYGILAICSAVVGVGAVALDLREGNIGRGLFWYAGIMYWVIMLFAWIYEVLGLSANNLAFKPDFPTAMYFSLVTWTTVGYGDLAPVEDARLWAACEALIGLVYTGVLVSILVAFITPRRSQGGHS